MMKQYASSQQHNATPHIETIFHFSAPSLNKVIRNILLVKVGRCYEMETNVKKTKVEKNTKQPSPVLIVTDQKQPENVEYFKYLGSMITNDARCTCEIKSKIAMAKDAFNKKKKKKTLFTSQP